MFAKFIYTSFPIVIVKLFSLQVINSSSELIYNNASVQKIYEFPERGYIYDRNNKLIVSNDFSYDIIQIANSLRKSNINTEFYPDSVSLKKQLNYANKNMIPYVLFYGEEEKENLYFNLKDMNSGNQQKLSKDQLLKVLVEN